MKIPGLPARPARAVPTRKPEADTARAWVAERFADARDGLLARRDGTPVAALRVMPAPFGLLSDRERAARVAGVHEALRAVDRPWQIVTVQRPVDLDAYLRALEAAVAETDAGRRPHLRQYAEYVRRTVTAGEATERRYFLLVHGKREKGAEALAVQAAAELAGALGRAGLDVRPARAAELHDAIAQYLAPARAADEEIVYGAELTTYQGVAAGV